eukprot:gb/GECG01009852.1/.p1 GENE.gb/GECG01009852.1/~~gb/GECG01009852.1/.p1  ORF type:complete len:1126 (+),score=150.26 gb/GECG01009852.1/:1-3378(+)
MASTPTPKSFARRDRLAYMQDTMQKLWEEEGLHQQDAPEGESENPPKFLVTFPYPYMNGKLHLGHAFSMTKAEFAARFHRILGEKSLFPFAFHCTGMPIQAAANKLKREMDEAEKALETGDEGSNAQSEESKEGDDPEHKAPGQFHAKKAKVAAKSGKMTQTQILKGLGVPDEELPHFQDPHYWLKYFPPYGQRDLKRFGVQVDWRRSFITTDANPYYDSFIRWQFRKLREEDKIAYGKRPTIYSVLDGQACADHDRSSGEGVLPQEYTLIKMKVVRNEDGKLPRGLADLEQSPGQFTVYFVAATLRPETMYGQTNCFLLPDGEYGAFKTNEPNTIFVCSERSAWNMAHQDLSPEYGRVECMKKFHGVDLLGIGLKAPRAKYDCVYTLPLLTISMSKGTGVVTSVPSDAPDDYAALRDVKEKPKLREKYGIESYMVDPYDVVEIIDIPGFGSQPAVKLCDELGIKSQNDKDKLRQAKEKVYLKGFYEGVMLVGTCKGKKVFEAKNQVKGEMVEEGEAVVYWEPEREVVSRSGDECVVAHLNQWYLKYGEEQWKKVVQDYVESDTFQTYNPAVKNMFLGTLDWLHEWACSRNFGLGTLLPWDEQFVIESLSDSTIYMAYYTVAHLLQGGVLDGQGNSPAGIKPEQLSDEVWDFIFRDGDEPKDTTIPKDMLLKLRREFRYWYPVDLRVSGKDLINNHLTMCLYNHAAIWKGRKDRMPQSFYTNGHVLVDGQKMAKSLGNFLTITDGVDRWTADGVRMALADAGDGLDDANFDTGLGDGAILRLTTEEETFNNFVEGAKSGAYRAGGELSFIDKVFQNRVRSCAVEAKREYRWMKFKQALKFCFWDMLNAKDEYRDACEKLEVQPHQDLLREWMESLCVMLSPICPHWTDYMWRFVLDCPRGVKTVHHAVWPEVNAPDAHILQTGSWIRDSLHVWRVQIEKEMLRKLGAKSKNKNTELSSGEMQAAVWEKAAKMHANLYVAPRFADWQIEALQFLSNHYDPETNSVDSKILPELAKHFTGEAGEHIRQTMGYKDKKAWKNFVSKTIMAFVGSKVNKELPERGREALSTEMPFDEIALLKENIDYVTKGLGVEHVNVLDAYEATGNARAGRALPGSPVLELFDPNEDK